MDQNSIWSWPNFTILWLSRTFLFFFSKLAVKLPRPQPKPFFYSGKIVMWEYCQMGWLIDVERKLWSNRKGNNSETYSKWRKNTNVKYFSISNSKTVFTFTNGNFFPISSFAKVEKRFWFWCLSSIYRVGVSPSAFPNKLLVLYPVMRPFFSLGSA